MRRSTLREMHAGQAWARWGDDVPVLRRLPNGAPALTAFSYGLGWAQNTTCLAEGMIQHGGFEPGYYATIRLLPAHGLGIVTLSATARSAPSGCRCGRTSLHWRFHVPLSFAS